MPSYRSVPNQGNDLSVYKMLEIGYRKNLTRRRIKAENRKYPSYGCFDQRIQTPRRHRSIKQQPDHYACGMVW